MNTEQCTFRNSALVEPRSAGWTIPSPAYVDVPLSQENICESTFLNETHCRPWQHSYLAM